MGTATNPQNLRVDAIAVPAELWMSLFALRSGQKASRLQLFVRAKKMKSLSLDEGQLTASIEHTGGAATIPTSALGVGKDPPSKSNARRTVPEFLTPKAQR